MTRFSELNDICILKVLSYLSYTSLKNLTQLNSKQLPQLINEEYSKRKEEIKFLSYQCKGKKAHRFNLQSTLNKQLDSIRTNPELLLAFSTDHITRDSFGSIDCKQIFIQSSGILHGNPRSKQYFHAPSHENYFGCKRNERAKPALSGISLAKYPHAFRIQIIEDLSEVNQLKLDNNEQVACLILFINKKSPKIDNLWSFFNDNSIQKSYAICASFVDSCQFSDVHVDQQIDFIGICFIGKSKKLKIKQVVIPSANTDREPRVYKKQEETLVEYVSKLLVNDGDQIVNKAVTNQFAFQFNSSSPMNKSNNYFNYESNIELNVFRNVFPLVPIVGVVTDGHIANDYYDNQVQITSFKRLYNSTVFTFFSIDCE